MYLLIPAAGSGRRMGASCNKLLLKLWDRSLLGWTLASAGASKSIIWIGIIGQRADFPDFKAIADEVCLNIPIKFIIGGETRQESVYNGLQALPREADRVLIHDGARCLATPDLFDRCTKALESVSGLIAAIPVKDTIKIVDGNNFIQDTPDRRQLWAAQTPQGFEVPLLRECHEKGRHLGWDVTDDAALFERCGLPVQVVEGEETNLKVTTPVDLQIAEFILRERLAK
ncbi:2-C-methyl-D-erythritol 4-phosphate cytidylyltransferase [Arthrospira platensis]|jgi:2-C-methyl-D-erythritol 4-phosphate cytidylyltransferase|uniref:2-C-methyl-D-erythritol 4-phosphate cytidylyltransferase n=1 Tax=Limnospira platensis NIES-46 TaxID=1236695 RepID=A0A5M3T0W5_LIMPL|nr:2-C-methyl-D-erythritol 4-phosphate cytidylyltransferase [Arthrospira platensis]AMW31029.1 2-C-methyl-D-erythritol 4-phosphate cytidylyltransferase [Arthrospira platensis YZ]KDR54804.1 2-C-methyl-D-erythritol 4-phosphate cytidylyltransferase [Arthrospira platensis str. Paraca]MBD2670542.1 2-C-methyl-D-erythritol 4-phosphate cytidylyltransferase [Arthrospira platensis FACHB-439]MBD2711365.1 2-C-methyl-D-erythritol 4-phosphate cytidylyltransferase [Arthrospira platensis FACHB-835]MDF2208410.1